MAVTPSMVRTLALKLPDTEESPWYGKPAFKVGGKGFARLHEDGESLVLRISMIDREYLMQLDPATFYITDHYRNFPAVLVRMARLDRAYAAELLESAWQFVAATGTARRKPASRTRKRSTAARRPGRQE